MQFREARHRRVFKAGDLPQICHQNCRAAEVVHCQIYSGTKFFFSRNQAVASL
jgi:hypothetical protein